MRYAGGMNIAVPDLKSQLLARLRPFFTRNVSPGEHRHACQMFSYCALERERIASVVLEMPVIGIVLRGQKEVWRGDAAQILRPGTVFVFPRGVPLDVVNVPDAVTGIYESLLLTVDKRPAGLAPLKAPRRPQGFAVTLTPDLAEAVCHAATTIADPAHGEALCELRFAELLTLLASDPAGRLALTGDLSERAEWVIAQSPAHGWSVGELARELGVGASTLRRRLDEAGQPFRQLLAGVRMQAAREALRNGASMSEAAVTAGYASRSHFYRAYRAHHGHPPRRDQQAA